MTMYYSTVYTTLPTTYLDLMPDEIYQKIMRYVITIDFKLDDNAGEYSILEYGGAWVSRLGTFSKQPVFKLIIEKPIFLYQHGGKIIPTPIKKTVYLDDDYRSIHYIWSMKNSVSKLKFYCFVNGLKVSGSKTTLLHRLWHQKD